MSQATAPKKALGQHWLFDPASLTAMADAANVTATDTILEVGPGRGPLTAELVRRAGQVIAVEFDPDLAAELPARVPADNLQVVHQDILQFDLTQLPTGYKVVANIPYYLTSKLVRLLVESPTPPDSIVLLVQKEVAERLAAAPGDMSLLALCAQIYTDVELGLLVGREKFAPAPKVDSQIVVLKRRPHRLFPDSDIKLLFRIARAGFAGKRKTLRNSLSGGLQLDKSSTEQWLMAAGVSPEARAEALHLEDWHRLTESLPHFSSK